MSRSESGAGHGVLGPGLQPQEEKGRGAPSGKNVFFWSASGRTALIGSRLKPERHTETREVLAAKIDSRAGTHQSLDRSGESRFGSSAMGDLSGKEEVTCSGRAYLQGSFHSKDSWSAKCGSVKEANFLARRRFTRVHSCALACGADSAWVGVSA
jgi:hypothetical protein